MHGFVNVAAHAGQQILLLPILLPLPPPVPGGDTGRRLGHGGVIGGLRLLLHENIPLFHAYARKKQYGDFRSVPL